MNPWLLAPPVVLTGLAGLTAYGAVNARSQLFGPTLYQTDSAKRLALTFDDGPNPAITPKLLDILDRYNAKATFFVVGNFVRECPGLVKDTAACGHVIGNHTHTHPNLFFCGPAETREELQRCNDAISHATWEQPRWFRPPFGFRSPWLGEIVHQHSLRTVMWTLLPGDWRAKPVVWLIPRLQPIADHLQRNSAMGSLANGIREGTASAVPKSATNRGVLTPEAGSHGDILCLHDGDYTQLNGDRSRTLAALEHWLPRWSDLGLEFVTMNQL